MEIKCQLDATEAFIADLIACSTCFGHHYGFGGLGVACWPLVPKFASSNPDETVGLCGFVYFCNVWGCVCVGFVLYGCVRLM